MVNMLEVLLGDYCDRKGIVHPGKSATALARNRTRAGRRAHEGSGSMTFRYIGSKSRLIDQIKDHIGHPQEDAFFVDAFLWNRSGG